MGTWQSGQRPITFAILAMGGEGGAVLSNWVADTATASTAISPSALPIENRKT